MNLKLVTITGADESVDPCDLAAISGRYPFVEWAFLLSQSKTGLEPRYPSLRYLAAATDVLAALAKPRIAVHLCGRLARDAAVDNGRAVDTANQLVSGVNRIQINLGNSLREERYQWVAANLRSNVVANLRSNNYVQMIIQAVDFDTPAVRSESRRGVVSVGPDCHWPVFLHDASGGTGNPNKPFQRPVNAGFVGFAGGICPENVESRLGEIAAMGIENPFWIDMESGVRTDDRFDLEKVEAVLSIAERYIQNEH